MALFKDKESEFVTRDEAQSALSAYVTKEEATAVVNQLNGMDTRVRALETLAEQIKGNNAHRVQVAEQPSRSGDYTITLPTRTPGATLGVDYGAIAFGLSEIKHNVTRALSVQGGGADLAQQYEGTVQYFADVFSKSDPSFDEALFKRQSGV